MLRDKTASEYRADAHKLVLAHDRRVFIVRLVGASPLAVYGMIANVPNEKKTKSWGPTIGHGEL